MLLSLLSKAAHCPPYFTDFPLIYGILLVEFALAFSTLFSAAVLTKCLKNRAILSLYVYFHGTLWAPFQKDELNSKCQILTKDSSRMLWSLTLPSRSIWAMSLKGLRNSSEVFSFHSF